jgi:hypothetical protein
MPDPPEPLLLERRIESGDDAYADRVTADGGVWTGGNVGAELHDGEWSFDRGERDWQRAGTLSPAALDRLRSAIAASGFFDTAAEHRPDTAVIHSAREVWTAELDGRRHSSVLHARGTTRVAALDALGSALEDALAGDDG